jgi:hypothetical protein
VVHLRVHGEATVVQPLDDVQLPQRAVPVQQAGVQPRGQLQQITHASRRRQSGAPDVVVDVDVVVVGPGDPRDAAADRRRVLAESGLEFVVGDQLLVELPDEFRTGPFRWLEQRQTAHVQRMLPRFGEQKHRVGGHHQFHARYYTL